MRQFVIIIILLLSSVIYCQQMWDQPLIIRDSENYYRSTKSIVTDDNCIIHVWSEVREGITDIFAMKFDNQGNSLWGEESTLINTSSYSKIFPQIVKTSDGGAVIAWLEIYSNPRTIRAQKINSEGQLLWGESGVLVTDNLNDQNDLTLLPNDLGGAIISWVSSNRIAANLNNEGIDQWNSLSLGVYRIVSDSENGLLLYKTEYSEDDNLSLVLKKINVNGEEEWTQSLVSLEDNIFFTVVSNNNGDFYIIENIYSYDYSTLNIKKLLANGTFSPAEYTTNITNLDMYCLESISYTTNDNGNLFICLGSSYNWETDSITLAVFNLNSQLEHVWDESGVNIATNSVSSENFLACTNSGEVFILSPAINTADNELTLYKIGSDGTNQTPEGGISICEDILNINRPFLAYNNDLFLTWEELEDNKVVFKQRVIDNNLQDLITEENEDIFQYTPAYPYIYNKAAVYPLADNERSLVIWKDNQSFNNNRILYQIINADGTLEFPNNGLEIATDSSFSADSFVTAQNNSGQICIVWESQSNFLIKSRIIDSDGTLLGNDSGDLIFDQFFTLTPEPLSISTYNNEFYLNWVCSDFAGNNYNFYGTKTTNATNWSEPLNFAYFFDPDFMINTINKNISNYCIIKTDYSTFSIYKITDNNEVIDLNQSIYSDDIKVDVDSNNNLFYSWADSNNHVFLQGINNSNELVWEDPLVVSIHPQYGDQVSAMSPSISISDGIYISWLQYTDISENEVRIQKYSFSGEKLWGEQGLLLSENALSAPYNNIEIANNEYLVVSWLEETTGYIFSKFNLIKSDGTFAYSDTALDLNETGASKFNIASTSLANDKMLFAWIQYYQGNYTLYTQKFDFSTVANDSNDIESPLMNLLSNYPNPFNPETTISFNLPQDSDVKLEIYNIKGQKVKSLLNSNLKAGRHSLIWNGTNNHNKPVASGLYFYRMQAGNKSFVRKCSLMK